MARAHAQPLAETSMVLSIEYDGTGIHVTAYEDIVGGPVIAEQDFTDPDDAVVEMWFLSLLASLHDLAVRRAAEAR